MKQLGDLFASFVRRDPDPTAKPSRLLNQADVPPRTKGGIPTMSTRMTKDSLKQIIASVNNDPLAGMGSLSKEDLLIDRLLAHWNTVEAPTVRSVEAPKPIITPTAKPQGSGAPAGGLQPTANTPVKVPA